MYHYTQSSNSFPMLFSMGNAHRGFDEGELYSASVDCTLSLGTPSTRAGSHDNNTHHHDKKPSSCSISNFGLKNILHPPTSSSTKPQRNSGADPLLSRRCANCDATSTPLWRNGPRGPKSLCNACGIRYKKEERRATATAAADETQYMMNGSWAPTQKTACYSSAYGNEYQFIEDDVVDHRDSEMGGGGVPFMSWRFNVTDMPSLVHDFTR